MKKVSIALTLMMMTGSMLTNNAIASSHCKKHHKCKKNKSAQLVQTAPLAQPVAFKDSVKPEESMMNKFLVNMSGSFDFTTNYVFRGVSQTMNLPAAQGGLTYTLPIGLYLSAWGSNVKFNDDSGASVELDAIAGLRGNFGETDFTYDLNVDRYNYPGAQSASYNEMIGILGYKIFLLTVGYSANAYNTHQTGIYTSGTVTFGIPPKYVLGMNDLTFSAVMGHYSLPRAAGNSYGDASLTLNKKLNNTYSIIAQWTGTDGRQHNSPYDGNQLLATIMATF